MSTAEKSLFELVPGLRDKYRIEKIKNEYPSECHEVAKQFYQCSDYVKAQDRPMDEVEVCLESFNLNQCIDENKEEAKVAFWTAFRKEEERKAKEEAEDEDDDDDDDDDE